MGTKGHCNIIRCWEVLPMEFADVCGYVKEVRFGTVIGHPGVK